MQNDENLCLHMKTSDVFMLRANVCMKRKKKHKTKLEDGMENNIRIEGKTFLINYCFFYAQIYCFRRDDENALLSKKKLHTLTSILRIHV